eukprot:2486360-Pleurochrysis_carterae.AAC.1
MIILITAQAKSAAHPNIQVVGSGAAVIGACGRDGGELAKHGGLCYSRKVALAAVAAHAAAEVRYARVTRRSPESSLRARWQSRCRRSQR